MSEEKAYRAAWLIAGYIRGTLTDAEKDELDEWITQSDANTELFAELTDEENIEAALKERLSYDSERAIKKLRDKIIVEKPAVRRSPRLMYTLAAAVSILLVLFFFFTMNKENSLQMEVANTDVFPGGHRAVLTIEGKKIVLDSSSKGTLWQQQALLVTDAEGKLTYNGHSSSLQWHTLSTPRGGEYQLQLPDGTLVWLNAESSIRFPNVFDELERKVEITGEAYFEVKKDSRRFIVIAGSSVTEVLGTHFNIKAYSDDLASTITLAEGSIKVSDTVNQKSTELQPGEQIIASASFFRKLNNVNIEEVLGWKNGWFYFNNESIESIMESVSRWYDIQVLYRGKIPYHFNAEIERNVPVSKLFELLEKTGSVHFEIKDKTIIVSP